MSSPSEAFDKMCVSLSMAETLLMAVDEANLLVLIGTPSQAAARRVGAGFDLVVLARKYLAEALEQANEVFFVDGDAK